jgi:hypothetical protein
MHHIVFCTPCIALFNYGHLLHIRVDHEETQWMFGDLQASSYEDTNIA